MRISQMTNLFNAKKSTDRHHIPAPSASRKAELKALDVPLIDLPDCHACEDPCDGEEAYARLDIDLNETDLLGSMNE